MKNEDDHAAPETRLGFALYKTGLAVSRAYARHLAPHGLSPAANGVLASLVSGGPAHVRELGRRLGLNRQSVVNLTEELERLGYVTKSPVETDKRVVLVEATREGRAFFKKADAVSRVFDEDLAAVLGARKSEELRAACLALLASPLLDDGETT